MIKLLMSLSFLALATLSTASLSQESANLEEVAEMIRDGKIDVGKEYSMHEKKGRFHNIHVDAVGMDCASCHYGEYYQADFLLLRKSERLVKKAKGQMNWGSCLGCHQTGGIATTWYVGRPGVK